MQSVSTETVFINSQYQKDDNGQFVLDENKERQLLPNEDGYRIKALNSLQFCEVMTDGFQNRNGEFVMTFTGVKLLLRYGLEDPALLNKLSAIEMTELANAIYGKAALSEAERKN